MKTEYWVALAIVVLFLFAKSGMPAFTGLTNQRGPFGTPGTPVDNSGCCS